MANTYSPPPITPGAYGIGMQRISSRGTFFNKRIFPLFWLGTLALVVLKAWPLLRAGRGGAVFVVLPSALMAVFVYVLLKKFVLDLMDEVWDAGDALIVKNGGVEERIALSNIMNVSYTTLQNPNRVTLTLRQPGRFGKEVSFSPPSRFVPFAKSPIIEGLIQRIDAARRA